MRNFKLQSKKIVDLSRLNDQTLTCFIFESLPSTNTFLKTLKLIKTPITCCLAEVQTDGRGRMGRTWISPYGQNIYLSLRTKVRLSPSALSMIPLVVGLSVSDSIRQWTNPHEVTIKWPNDVYIHHQKIAGILVETISLKPNESELVIGVGLNVNMHHSAFEIERPWTSLFEVRQQYLDRNIIAASLIENITKSLTLYQNQGPSMFIEAFSKKDFLLGKRVKVSQPRQTWVGIAQGIDEHGFLVVKTDLNEVVMISSGEASVIF